MHSPAFIEQSTCTNLSTSPPIPATRDVVAQANGEHRPLSVRPVGPYPQVGPAPTIGQTTASYRHTIQPRSTPRAPPYGGFFTDSAYRFADITDGTSNQPPLVIEHIKGDSATPSPRPTATRYSLGRIRTLPRGPAAVQRHRSKPIWKRVPKVPPTASLRG